MDAHSGFPVHYNNSDGKKKWTNHSLLFNESDICWNMSMRPEQHTLISVFKLNSCKLCQFKHLRARGRELPRAVRRFVRALIRSAQNPRLRKRANIKLSLKYCVWMDKFTQTLCQNARLGKYPIADIAGWTYSISALDQCILLKWQHFLNITVIKQHQQRNHSLLLIESLL